jgi:hypothetical protein
MIEKHGYLNRDILNLKSAVIREFDLRDAGFSIIKNNNLFDDELKEKISQLSKQDKNVTIGKILRDHPNLSQFMMDELAKLRQKFVDSNNIKEENILSIKRDALFIMNQDARNLNIDGYTWQVKGKYSSYLYVNRKEFYYDPWSDTIDIKGLSSETKESCSLFINDIKRIIRSWEKLPKDKLIRFLRDYRFNYLDRRLPLESYRELNRNFSYRLNFSIDNNLYLSQIQNLETLEIVDISYNYINYIIPIIGLLI